MREAPYQAGRHRHAFVSLGMKFLIRVAVFLSSGVHVDCTVTHTLLSNSNSEVIVELQPALCTIKRKSQPQLGSSASHENYDDDNDKRRGYGTEAKKQN